MLDKLQIKCFNILNQFANYIKTMTENMPSSFVAESRRTVRADTDGFGILLPESVLSKHVQVMGHGFLRYRVWPYLRPKSDFPFEGGN